MGLATDAVPGGLRRIFGLIAASVVFGFAHPDLLPERGRRLFGAAMLPYLALMLWSGFLNEGTDNYSHLGGLMVGGPLLLLLDPVPLQRRPGRNRRVQLTGIALIVVCSACSRSLDLACTRCRTPRKRSVRSGDPR